MSRALAAVDEEEGGDGHEADRRGEAQSESYSGAEAAKWDKGRQRCRQTENCQSRRSRSFYKSGATNASPILGGIDFAEMRLVFAAD